MKNLKKFWLTKSKIIKWKAEPKLAFKYKSNNKISWYPDGKLNVAENCLIHSADKKKTAIISISKEKKIKQYSYLELNNIVNNFSDYLNNISKKNNYKSVLIHSSASIVSAVSMLTFAKLGIHFSVVFEDLPEKALDIRVKLIKPDLIITRSKSKCDFFIKSLNKNGLRKSIIINSEKKSNNKKVLYFNFEKTNLNSKSNFNPFSSERLLFTLFTSGSTGEPKGVQHSSGGYLLYSKYSCIEQFGMNKMSRVLVASDAGWINGHTYALFGPLSLGATTILLETPLSLLDYSFLEKILNKYKVTILYLPVTLLRLLKGLIPEKNKILKNSLQAIGSMGEPLAETVGIWYSKLFFKKLKPVINTYFQTETGGIIASPKYNQKAASTFGTVGKPINKFIKFLKPSKNKFELKIQHPWPGCMVNIINGSKFWKEYWDKSNFKLFDVGSYKNKNLIIHGRSDDVINIRGHRLGSGEIESRLLEIDYLLEACAIAQDNYFEGANLVLFITLKKKITESKVKSLINEKIINFFGSFALPKKILVVKELPKTKSGKILRRVLRNIYENPKSNSYGDLSTMINQNSIKNIQNSLIND
tara:strand:- start:234 stop:1997 length:1764 start_codon:yes stop_codon:yes gene_type:complete